MNEITFGDLGHYCPENRYSLSVKVEGSVTWVTLSHKGFRHKFSFSSDESVESCFVQLSLAKCLTDTSKKMIPLAKSIISVLSVASELWDEQEASKRNGGKGNGK